jgi:hypothetical protein
MLKCPALMEYSVSVARLEVACILQIMAHPSQRTITEKRKKKNNARIKEI